MKKIIKRRKNKDLMSITDHFRELRNRMIVCAVALTLGFCISLSFSSKIVDVLIQQGTVHGYKFIFIAPQEMIIQYFRVAFISALIITIPVLLYEIWAFFTLGLKKKDKFYFLSAMVMGLVCFLIGVTFAFKITLPFMLNFLIKSNSNAAITASISVASYLSFIFTVYFIFGTIFEMPMVTVILTRLGLLRPEWMKVARPYVIVICFFIAAVITPPDIISQVMVAIPTVILYELSIVLCKILYRKKEVSEVQES